MNSILIQFRDGLKVITSRFAVRKNKKMILYKNKTKVTVSNEFIEAGFLESKYIKNEWNRIGLRERILMYISNELKLYCNETLNNKQLNFLESELNHKKIY